MNKNKIISIEKPAESSGPIHDLIRNGAHQLIQPAIESELQTGIRPVRVKVPKIRSRTGEPTPIAISTLRALCV